MEEARYLLSKLMGMTLNQAALAAQRDAGNKELQSQVPSPVTEFLVLLPSFLPSRNLKELQ